MATETLSKAEPIKAFANAHANDLYDVVALLEAVAERIDAAPPPTTASQEAADTMHNTLRLVQMASEKAKALADLMFDES